MGMTTLIIGLVLLIGATIAFLFMLTAQYRNINDKLLLDFKKFAYLTLGVFALAVLGSSLAAESGYVLKSIEFTTSRRLYFYLGGSLFFALTFGTLLFLVAYKKKVLENKKIEKYVHLIALVGMYAAIVALFAGLDGIVSLMHFPLNKNLIEIGNLHIAYYAMFILTGAVLAYVLAVRNFVKLGYRKNIIENLFYVAFPAGIIGARIWYVIAQWSKEFADQPFVDVFKIWNGGLAIQGGIIFGALFGVLFMLRYRPRINILMAADLIVPGILLAQAIGRWGNFFNHEVFGAEVSRQAWSFLPDWMLNQMYVEGAPDKIYVPLFLIEAITNIIGYFVLRYFVGEFLKKKNISVYGDVSCGYLIWYGVVRSIMEPMRNSEFIMGDKVQASVIMSYVFIGVGILGVIALHVIQRKKPNWFINKEITPEYAGIDVTVDEASTDVTVEKEDGEKIND